MTSSSLKKSTISVTITQYILSWEHFLGTVRGVSNLVLRYSYAQLQNIVLFLATMTSFWQNHPRCSISIKKISQKRQKMLGPISILFILLSINIPKKIFRLSVVFVVHWQILWHIMTIWHIYIEVRWNVIISVFCG